MTNDPETVGIDVVNPDPLLTKQQQDVQNMRNELMTCNTRDANSVKAAMNNILVMRIYHQISRIIKFTEQMDKIEEKLYASIDASLTTMMDTDPRTWMSLLTIQERLQKSMIESHKLLEPYLNMENLTYVEVSPEVSSDTFAKQLLDQESREKIRTSAQTLLAALDAVDSQQSSSNVEVNDDG